MAVKKDNSPATDDKSGQAKGGSSRKIFLLRGLGVLLFLCASAALFADVAGIPAAGGFFAGKAIFMLPLQLIAVALVDFANGRLRNHEFAIIQCEQAEFNQRTADKTVELERNITSHVYEVYRHTREEKEGLRKEVEELKDQENKKLFEQLERLKEEKSELEARLINLKFRDAGQKEDGEGGKIYAA